MDIDAKAYESTKKIPGLKTKFGTLNGANFLE